MLSLGYPKRQLDPIYELDRMIIQLTIFHTNAETAYKASMARLVASLDEEKTKTALDTVLYSLYPYEADLEQSHREVIKFLKQAYRRIFGNGS